MRKPENSVITANNEDDGYTPKPQAVGVGSGALLATPRTDAFLKWKQGMFRAAAAANGFADFARELERENARLREELREARATIETLNDCLQG